MILSEIYTALDNKDYTTVANEIKTFNYLYRKGDSEITDLEYDKLLKAFELADPTNEIFESGVIETEGEVNPNRKEELKYPMFSLDKETSIEDIHKWLKNRGLPLTTVLIVTSKYDGISVLKNEGNGKAWSRGDGIIGETMHGHCKKLNEDSTNVDIFTIGEMLIPKPIFASRTFYRDNGEPFKNARNMIAGLKNNDTPSDDLIYAKHVRYGFANEDYSKDKSEQLDLIAREINDVPYKVFVAEDLDVDELDRLFFEWGEEFDIDGLVIDINDKNIRRSLGRGRNNNPAYAKAYKNPDWSEVTEVPYRGIEWNLSKTTALKPVVLLEPFDVEGVTIKRATGYNAKFIQDNNIGAGSILSCIRSGSVIPKIVGIVKKGETKLPTVCPSCGNTMKWNETNIDLVCDNPECEEINFQKLAFFFVRFKLDGFGEKSISKFNKAGYNTVKKILEMSHADIVDIDGMASKSATKLLNQLDEKVRKVPFHVVGHASGCFENLGSKKLKMIVEGIKEVNINITKFKECVMNNDFKTIPSILEVHGVYEVTVQDLNEINGMSDKSSENFLNGIVKFANFMGDLDIKIVDEEVKEVVIDTTSGIDLSGRVFVFTGFRDTELQATIESYGGEVKSGITKATTDLLTKNEDTTSSKAKKAKANGANVIQVDVFKESLNYNV